MSLAQTALCLLLLLAAPGIELPAQKDAVVLRLADSALAVSGGTTVIEILADGTLRADGKPAPARLTAGQLQDLLRYVVEERKFFETDDASIAKALEKRTPPLRCGNGVVVTEIRVRIRGNSGARSQPLLESNAADHPDLAQLVCLRDIAQRLRLEARLAQSGGRERVTGWLAQANARLKQRHPDEPPFAIEHFQGMVDVPDSELALRPEDDPNLGTLHGSCAHFSRVEGTPQRIVSAVVRTTDPEEPLVAVTVQG